MSNVELKDLHGADIAGIRNAAIGGDAFVGGSAQIEHNLKVKGWLEARKLKTNNLGVFASFDALQDAYPFPNKGEWAIVGPFLPGDLYYEENGEWKLGGKADGILLDVSAQYNENMKKVLMQMAQISSDTVPLLENRINLDTLTTPGLYRVYGNRLPGFPNQSQYGLLVLVTPVSPDDELVTQVVLGASSFGHICVLARKQTGATEWAKWTQTAVEQVINKYIDKELNETSTHAIANKAVAPLLYKIDDEKFGGVMCLNLGSSMTAADFDEIAPKLKSILDENKHCIVTVYDTASKEYYGDCEVLYEDKNVIRVINNKISSSLSGYSIVYAFDLANKKYTRNLYSLKMASANDVTKLQAEIGKIYDELHPVELSVGINSNGLFEKGLTKDVTVSWKLTEVGSAAALSLESVTINGAAVTAAELSAGSKTISNVKATTSYTVKANYKSKYSGLVATYTGSVQALFVDPGYFGAIGDDFEIEESNFAGLAKFLRANTVYTGTGSLKSQRALYAYPASFGLLTSIKDQNNFEYINSYEHSQHTLFNVLYNVYILKEPVTVASFKHIYR